MPFKLLSGRVQSKVQSVPDWIKPSLCMFVCVVVDRVGECRAFTYCLSGVCMVCTVCMCLCFSRALPIVFPVARHVYSFGVLELSLEVRGGEAGALAHLFYPYIRYRVPIERGPQRM